MLVTDNSFRKQLPLPFVVMNFFIIFSLQRVRRTDKNTIQETNLEDVSLVINQLASVQDVLPILSVIPEVKKKKKKAGILKFYLLLIL